LQSREELLNGLFADARSRLKESKQVADSGLYEDLLRGLLLQAGWMLKISDDDMNSHFAFQGLYQLMEKEVEVVCRKVDVSIVQSILDRAVKEFESTVKSTVHVTISGQNLADAWHGPMVCMYSTL
jgi:V-type H+-transporting ATPase subunit E